MAAARGLGTGHSTSAAARLARAYGPRLLWLTLSEIARYRAPAWAA